MERERAGHDVEQARRRVGPPEDRPERSRSVGIPEMSKVIAQARPVWFAAFRTWSRTRSLEANRPEAGPPGRSTTKCWSQAPSIP